MWKIEDTKDGGILDAYKVFHGLDDPNVVAYSSKLNEVVFLCLLKACSNTFDLKEVKELILPSLS